MPQVSYEQIAEHIKRAIVTPTPEEAVIIEARRQVLARAKAPVQLPPGTPPWAAYLLDKLDALAALIPEDGNA